MTEFIFMIFESISWPVALIIGFILLFLHGAVLTPPSELSLAVIGLYATLHQWFFLPAVITTTAGNLAGCIILFLLSRQYSDVITQFVLSSRFKYLKYLVSKARSDFHKNGQLFVLYGRFIPNIRSAVSIPAGFSNMSLSSFLIYSGIGCLSWSLIWVSVGFFIGQHLIDIIEAHNIFALALFILIIIGAIGHRFIFYKNI